ncbi:hypothetical protein B5F53_11660 [Blautia sp. An249]|uniref:hypothetical protein n=1 Tax=Blautia sp. An249 TaxID=1965603 RepID=UPI000B387BB4|nr:hypothetical protein [Blautia sp. An249]OUO78197.1 hypothetical protein B5F53_11660 [Blautia sp. An249]
MKLFCKKYGKTATCTVSMSEELAKLCEPCMGDPRGPIGIPSTMTGQEIIDSVKEMMLCNGSYVLSSEGYEFVCIPREQYEFVLNKIIESQSKSGRFDEE